METSALLYEASHTGVLRSDIERRLVAKLLGGKCDKSSWRSATTVGGVTKRGAP
jgi:hypothetical protein